MNELIRADKVGDRAVVMGNFDAAVAFDAATDASEHRHSGLPVQWQGGVPQPRKVTLGTVVQLLAKRIFDLVLAGGALLVFGPFLILTAVAVKVTSPGPVFFRQQREGLDGELFFAFKFRSMKVEECDDSGIVQTQAGDPRITPIGRFLRRTSIDELPQLLNVLRGEMSVVGPRPHVPGMLASGSPYDRLVPYYRYRLQMLPGITGWAQANGFRGPTVDARSAKARIDHDVAYIQNYSLLLDVKIILKTIRSEFFTGSGH